MNTNIKTEEVKQLPQLCKGSSIYKLIVPEKVEEKIRYLLRKFPHTEWSGVLFTTHEGSFENNDLVVTCQDIYPMDLGTAVYTEFNMSEDVAAYMAEHIELFDCDLQILHSHHTMSCTPSGTDLNTLREEGNERNCFVSLIVNHAGTYYAAITRKVQTKSEVTIKNLGTSYEFFGEGSKEISKDNTETTKTIDKEYIEYFDLEVERHEVPNTLGYLDTRFEEIEQKKASARVSQQKEKQLPWNDSDDEFSFRDWLHSDKKSTYKEQSFLENDKAFKQGFTKEDVEKFKSTGLSWTPDSKKIHKALCNILMCNLIINPDKINLKQWVNQHMVNVYRKVFGEDCLEYVNSNFINSYSEWKDFIIQHTFEYFDMDGVPNEVLDEQDLFISKIAEALLKELEVLANANAFTKDYYETISAYITE